MALGILQKSTCAAVMAVMTPAALAQEAPQEGPEGHAQSPDAGIEPRDQAGDQAAGEADVDAGHIFQLRPGRMTNPSRPNQTTAIAPGQSGTPPSVLAILAHPNDEIMIAPILARMARSGGEVAIAFVTSGAAGPGVSGMEPGAALAALREDEARCSAFALGLPEPTFWQFEDSAAADALAEEGASKESMEEGGVPDMHLRIAELIALKSPQMVMTWGPEGGYGDPDHRRVSQAVRQVVQVMGESGEAERPDLLYSAIATNGDRDLAALEGWGTLDASLITDRIAYEFADLETARIAIDCYQSQYSDEARGLLPSILDQNVWRGTVSFRLAFANQR